MMGFTHGCLRCGGVWDVKTRTKKEKKNKVCRACGSSFWNNFNSAVVLSVEDEKLLHRYCFTSLKDFAMRYDPIFGDTVLGEFAQRFGYKSFSNSSAPLFYKPSRLFVGTKITFIVNPWSASGFVSCGKLATRTLTADSFCDDRFVKVRLHGKDVYVWFNEIVYIMS